MDEAAPSNLEAEASVLGALMVSEAALRRVLVDTGLRAEHFYSDKHRLIFGAASRLAALDKRVDALTVSAELERTAKLDKAGGKAFVSHLASVVPAPGNARDYALLVIEAAQLRAYQTGAREILRGVQARDREQIQQGIETASTDLEHANEPVEPMELADEMAEYLYTEGEGEVLRLPWGRMNTLASGGLYPGQVTALIGFSGHGKTTVLDSMLDAFHIQGARSLILGTEMTRRERVARFIASKTNLPFAKIMLRQLKPEEREKALEVLNRLPFAYRETPRWSVQQICQEIIARKVDVAAIDPIQGLLYRDTNELRNASQQILATAQNAGINLILVCHLSQRRIREAVLPMPVQSDIRDSSSIAADANNILVVHRDQEKDGTLKETGTLKWEKVRNGISGSSMKVKLIAGGYGFEPLSTQASKPPTPKQSALVTPHDP